MSTLTAAILVISDTASRDPSTDKARETLTNAFTEHGNGQWTIAHTQIVPDNALDIAVQVQRWSDDSNGNNKINLIVTTGGTGFATKDVTPEAVEPLLPRKAPGLVHAMLAKSLEVTPFAMMSRPVAGVRNGAIIVTLPGSPKGAKENLESIIRLLPHACMQAAGMDSRTLHAGGVKKLETDAGISTASSGSQHDGDHHHHNHSHAHGHAIPRAHTRPEDRPQSNDPSAGPSQRYRESPYPMLTVEDAIKTILEHTPAPTRFLEQVDENLGGYILAEDITAVEAVPAFRASIVDGYAVVVGNNTPSLKGTFPVVSVSHAAPGEIPPLQAGQVTRITTGAPLPPGATSVVMVEDTVLKSMTEDGSEEKEVEILTDEIQPDENVREIGSDIKAGEVILRKGEKLGPGEIGLLASVGVGSAWVFKKPVIGVMSTGDEIVQHNRPGSLQLGEVRDCNRPTVATALKSMGYQVEDLGIARDSPGSLEASLRDAMRKCDLIVTTGGVSMGELDLLKPTIERSLGGTIHFGRVSMKPGKPTTFATIPFKNNQGDPEQRLIFSLPGNPASAITCTSLFVLPSLAKASGALAESKPHAQDWKMLGLPRAKVILAEKVNCDKAREEYQRATVTFGQDGRLNATLTGGQRSSRVGSFRSANALLVLPAGGGTLEKGIVVEALIMGL